MFLIKKRSDLSGDITIVVKHGQPRFIFQVDGTSSIQSSKLQFWHRTFIVALVILASHLFVPETRAFSADEITTALNAMRVQHGQPALHAQPALTAAAEAKAQNMIDEQYFGHVSPSGKTPWSWYRAAGYAYTEAGENLAMDFATVQDVIDGWMQSAPHQKNLLDKKFLDIGVAVINSELNHRAAQIIVAEFGRQTSTHAVTTVKPPINPEPTPDTVQPQLNPQIIPPAPPEPAFVAATPEPSLPSIVSGQHPLPNLQFSLIEPADRYLGPAPRAPRVAGASIEPILPISFETDISTLVLLSLGLSFLLVMCWALVQGSWLQPTLSTG